ncbi:NADPH2 dehydrogenase [Lecanosticta acicola]|uniref:NADPH2 dehydrogenase n=1 Tax=Lecanosticta acicola TaxID=111012 RepID=A0AAI9EES8_9PEZI|nr:NADPH2 dehydrogenase [Lecanosticta acicola]
MGSAPPKSKLFEPLQIGSMKLSNRIVMAPLTRFRAEDNHVVMDMAQEYYEQRAKAYPGTLIVSEAVLVSPRASGYPNVPGIWNQEQIDGWRKIVERVHKAGSYIYLQLWALGRVANPGIKTAEGTGDVVSSSPTPYAPDAPVPRELSEAEIWQYIADYATAARNAIQAGFDGVEIHAANGYLIDQFTQDTCNKRTDQWGGSIANRARFGVEVTKAVMAAVGAHKTGIRLSPYSEFQGMKMADPMPQFTHLAAELRRLRPAYLHLVESRISGNADIEATEKIDALVQVWGATSPVLIAGGFTPDSARRAVDEEYKDRDLAVVFGRYFIPNPDLVYRIANGIELRKYERDLFYNAKSPQGYIDYDFCEQWKKEHGA